jgi:hypothetical protein
MITWLRSITMPRKREAADAVAKKIGEVMREKTTDVVAEELPDDVKKLLDRLRQSTPRR